MQRLFKIIGSALLLCLATQSMAGVSTHEDRLNRQMENFAAEWTRLSPILASRVGLHTRDHLLDERTDGSHNQFKKLLVEHMEALAQISRPALSKTGNVNADFFDWLLRNEYEAATFDWHRVSFDTVFGWHDQYALLMSSARLIKKQDFENYIGRLHAFSKYADQHIDIMRSGLDMGFSQPCVTLTGYADGIENFITDDISQSSFFKPFQNLPASFSKPERIELQNRARLAIANNVYPAYQRYANFFRTNYLTKCRRSTAASDLPDGDRFYRHRVRYFTTLPVTPEAVHSLGLKEVARIRKEMYTIIRDVGFSGSFAEFLAKLRISPEFYTSDQKQYVSKVEHIAKQVDAKLPAYFSRLPRLPWGIMPIPAPIAPKSPSGRYLRGAPDGSRAAFFLINLHDIEHRPLYELPALTVHEGMPGHHLQIALHQELQGLPRLRNYYGFHAFSEGWALYAESLANEMGVYTTPYEQFGRLIYEMWRACRLVVDTGLHSKGWTRDQAIRYLEERTALSTANITSEVDRYITYPGQALSYKTGELKIKELRQRAEQALGEQFSLREFHTQLLSSGALPLQTIERIIDQWINNQRDRNNIGEATL